MTQISTRNEPDRPANLIHRPLDALSETQVVFVREKAITERDDVSMPTISQQKIERHRRAMIDVRIRQKRNMITIGGG